MSTKAVAIQCDQISLDSIKNKLGWTISGHNTVCDGFGGNSAIYIYVYPPGETEGRKYLVMRYSAKAETVSPKMEWIDENKLSIHVGHVSQITKMISSIGSVKISYEVDKEDYPKPK